MLDIITFVAITVAALLVIAALFSVRAMLITGLVVPAVLAIFVVGRYGEAAAFYVALACAVPLALAWAACVIKRRIDTASNRAPHPAVRS